MQDAIFKVKAELGNDAIILNTRRFKKAGFFGLFGKKKVEVLAVIDPSSETEQNNDHLSREINSLKNTIQNLSHSWQQPNSFCSSLNKSYAQFYTHLKEQGVKEDITKKIISELQQSNIRDFNPEYSKQALMGLLKQPKPIKEGVIAFIGPTGVGKTTTIAKLAAKFSLEDNKRVGLITADTYRIGAVEQLKTYSDIINTSLEVIYDGQKLSEVIRDRFKGYDLVLIDTPGSSWSDKMQLGKLNKLINHSFIDEVHLVLSLSTKPSDIRSIITKYSTLNPDKLVLTKLDETTTYGDIVNIYSEYGLPYSYITFGQNVPDDIKIANSQMLVNYILNDLLNKTDFKKEVSLA